MMRPQLQEDDGYTFWHDADSPVSQDPDDGYVGIADSEVEAYITILKGENATLRTSRDSARELLEEMVIASDRVPMNVDIWRDVMKPVEDRIRAWLDEDGEES